MSGTSVSTGREIPILNDGFSLLSLEERAQWREYLARQIIAMQVADNPVPQWKIEEQVRPMMVTVAVMIERGFENPQMIKKYFGSKDIGCEYAASE
ncbi:MULTISPECIES: hypothetical protein [Pseudomonas syringae group]|jgi:hypothetical protein|uniref:hypothetical protein n=1 Tax=Pseudomonas syringae group TaxID=136849 RepID=UPI0006E61EF9|nr:MULTISPECIES: hypothetical protein [Pseudomonas syringae group]KPY55715.1 hypothetical protein ALO93_200217 [Pseudomonas amygdali pv. sesami]QOI07962.1 hypothetical protein D5S10_30025 [Pseudomonas savastanoi]